MYGMHLSFSYHHLHVLCPFPFVRSFTPPLRLLVLRASINALHKNVNNGESIGLLRSIIRSLRSHTFAVSSSSTVSSFVVVIPRTGSRGLSCLCEDFIVGTGKIPLVHWTISTGVLSLAAFHFRSRSASTKTITAIQYGSKCRPRGSASGHPFKAPRSRIRDDRSLKIGSPSWRSTIHCVQRNLGE